MAHNAVNPRGLRVLGTRVASTGASTFHSQTYPIGDPTAYSIWDETELPVGGVRIVLELIPFEDSL